MTLFGIDVLGATAEVEKARRRATEAEARAAAARAKIAPPKAPPAPPTSPSAPSGAAASTPSVEPGAPLWRRSVLGVPAWKLGASGLLTTAIVWTTRRKSK